MMRAKLTVAGGVLALAVSGCAGSAAEEAGGFSDPIGRGFPIVTPPASASVAPPPSPASPTASAQTAAIAKASACEAEGTVRLSAAFLRGYEYRHVFLDSDDDTSTGYAVPDIKGGFGADYMIENDLLYRSAGKGWSWREVRGVDPLVSASGATSRWRVRSSYVGDTVIFNLARESGDELNSPVVPVQAC
jgi:hypothetical protein